MFYRAEWLVWKQGCNWVLLVYFRHYDSQSPLLLLVLGHAPSGFGVHKAMLSIKIQVKSEILEDPSFVSRTMMRRTVLRLACCLHTVSNLRNSRSGDSDPCLSSIKGNDNRISVGLPLKSIQTLLGGQGLWP